MKRSLMLLAFMLSNSAFAGFAVTQTGANAPAPCTSGAPGNYTTAHQAPPTINFLLPSTTANYGAPNGGYVNLTLNRTQASLTPGRIYGANTEWVSIVPTGEPPYYWCDWSYVNTGTIGANNLYAIFAAKMVVQPPTTGYEIRYYELVNDGGTNRWMLSQSQTIGVDNSLISPSSTVYSGQ
jgi:hypothetical protein